MLFDWELVKEEVITEVSNKYPSIPESDIRKVVESMKVVVDRMLIVVAYQSMERK